MSGVRRDWSRLRCHIAEGFKLRDDALHGAFECLVAILVEESEIDRLNHRPDGNVAAPVDHGRAQAGLAHRVVAAVVAEDGAAGGFDLDDEIGLVGLRDKSICPACFECVVELRVCARRVAGKRVGKARNIGASVCDEDGAGMRKLRRNGAVFLYIVVRC